MSKLIFRVLGCVLLLVGILAVGNRSQLLKETVLAQTTIQLQQVVGGLAFPVFITSSRDGTNRLFILERAGKIQLLLPGTSAPAATDRAGRSPRTSTT